MKKFALCVFCIFLFTFATNAQDICPAGKVCLDQQTANKLFNTVDQLIAAKDVIAKMLSERGASDAAIASAMKVIEGWKDVDVINGMMIAKYKDVIALYEKVITMYQSVVDALEKRLNKPRSAFSKFMTALKEIAILLAGVTLGRGLL